MKKKPIILTGCPPSTFAIADAGKRYSVAKYFGDDVQVITCRARDKPTYMHNPGDILFDDFIANVKRWKRAGGVAIYYKNASQAIAEYREQYRQEVQTFVDLDGVLFDFDGFFYDHHGIFPHAVQKANKNDIQMWEMVAAIPDFWTRLPLLPGARDLWDALTKD